MLGILPSFDIISIRSGEGASCRVVQMVELAEALCLDVERLGAGGCEACASDGLDELGFTFAGIIGGWRGQLYWILLMCCMQSLASGFRY